MREKKVKLEYNLEDHELEDVLEKALSSIRRTYMEPKREIPDKLADQIRQHYQDIYDRIIQSMMEGIMNVINSSK